MQLTGRDSSAGPHTRSPRRLVRRLIGAVGVLVLFQLAVHLLAERNVRSERDARRALGDRLYVETRGEGDPVVLLAGLHGSTRFWRDQFADLEDERRFIALDALGFGRSPWPDAEYTLDDHLGAIERTLRAEGATGKLTFVAHSFGTILAAHYAARHPEQVENLILLGTPIFDSAGEGRKRIGELSALAGIFSVNAFLAHLTCDYICAFRPVFSRLAPLFTDLPREVAGDSVLHRWDSFHGTLNQVLLRSPVRPALVRVASRAVFVHGRRDPITPLAKVERIADEIGAVLVPIDVDHTGYLRDPALIERLLRELSSPGRAATPATGTRP